MSSRNICSVDGCKSKMTDNLSFFKCPKDEGRYVLLSIYQALFNFIIVYRIKIFYCVNFDFTL